MQSIDASESATFDLRRRVLVVAAGALRGALSAQLQAEGFEVQDTDDAQAVVATIRAWRPDLVLVDEVLPGRSGRQVVLSLRAHGDTFAVPVAGVLTDVSVLNVLQWLRVGTTDIWRFPFSRDVATRTRALIDECDRSQVQLGRVKARLLAWTARAKLSGTVTTHAGTPFEGRATFVDGELKAAQFGSLSGEKALEQIIEIEDGAVSWEDAALTQPAAPVVAPSGYRVRVLVVEDDPTIRMMLTRQLEASHYLVEAAVDGQTGLQLANQKPWDIIVADLDLPKLDGWGLLRALKADVSLREIAVMLLSAHEGEVDTLKAARSGARAYLKKSGRSKQMLDAVSLLASPRARAWDALSERRETRVELRAMGPLWLLRTLAELDCSGRLELEDALGRYELVISQGHLLDATAQTGSLRVQGLVALEELLASRGEGRFVFQKLEPHEGARWLYEVLDEACEARRRAEQRHLGDAATRPGKLFLNEELALLFARRANVAELKVLDAVRLRPVDLRALAALAVLPVPEVEIALAELMRRGVLATEA